MLARNGQESHGSLRPEIGRERPAGTAHVDQLSASSNGLYGFASPAQKMD